MANSQIRALHMLGATGKVRFDTYQNRAHLVVPVVALMEGVIHAVNAETPEFVPLTTLQKAAATWNNRAAVLYHPKRNGKQCSANSPDVLAESGIGTIFNARVEGRKLLCEAWIDTAKATRLHPEMYERLLAGQTEEVSVGAYVVTDDKPGTFQGKPYFASWVDVTGDHLAFLPGGRGACSVEMGCGTYRAAMRVLGNKIELVSKEDVEMHDLLRALAPKVVAPITAPHACKCQGSSSADKPQLKAAGCGCHHKGHENGRGERVMEKSTRAELIAELVTDRYSGFRDGDESILEASSDARLEEFRSASDARKAQERSVGRLETELTNTSARLKVAEERLRTAEQAPTEEDWLAKAPPFFKTLLDNYKAEEDALRASLISQLKDLGANTEDQLKAKTTEDLKTLAAYARVEVPDFSGRGLPQERNASARNDDFTPPNPYAEGIKTLQSSFSKVN